MLEKVIVVGAILIVHGVGRSWQFCPGLCNCSNSELRVNCSVTGDENVEDGDGGEGGEGGGLTGGRLGLGNYLNEIPIFLNPQIQVLVLHGNKIGDLTPYSLQYYNRLMELDLSSNRIVVLGNGSFETLKSLKVLNISWNRVQALGNGAFRGLGTLFSLDVSGNDIETVDKETFKPLTALQTLNLDRNRIIQLDLSLFSQQSNLESLSAPHNRIQRILPTPTDQSVGERVREGDETSGESSGVGLSQLRYLNLSYNELDELPDGVLDSLVHLETLDLSHNAMQALEQNSLSNNLHLRTINLSYNKIESLPLYALSRCSQLRWLDLSHNHLRVLSSHYFHNLFKLEYLDISYNPRLERIERNALGDNINLVYFYADHLLQLNDIPLELLSNKPFLTLFSLQYASIQRLTISPSLDLDDNDTPSGPLVSQSHNQQQHEEAYFLSALQALHTLDLKGNPWECNCSALILYNYITDASRSVSDVEILEEDNSPKFFKNILCATPAQFSGIPLIKLNADSFTECVGNRDSFTQTVLILGASILSLIVFIIIVRIIITTGTCANLLGKKQANSPVDPQNFHLHPTYPPNQIPPLYPNQFRIIENYRRPPKFDMVDNPDEDDIVYSSRRNPRLDFTNQYTNKYDKQVPSVLV